MLLFTSTRSTLDNQFQSAVVLLMMVFYCECEIEISAVRQPWFFKLPDYYLRDVPKIIVNNEKYWIPLARTLLNFSGLAGQSETRIQRARDLQVKRI